jgi:hypothetical protein
MKKKFPRYEEDSPAWKALLPLLVENSITGALGDEILAAVDRYAKRAGMTRAEAVRRLVELGLQAALERITPAQPTVTQSSHSSSAQISYSSFATRPGEGGA